MLWLLYWLSTTLGSCRIIKKNKGLQEPKRIHGSKRSKNQNGFPVKIYGNSKNFRHQDKEGSRRLIANQHQETISSMTPPILKPRHVTLHEDHLHEYSTKHNSFTQQPQRILALRVIRKYYYKSMCKWRTKLTQMQVVLDFPRLTMYVRVEKERLAKSWSPYCPALTSNNTRADRQHERLRVDIGTFNMSILLNQCNIVDR